jgi:hypothetical protein
MKISVFSSKKILLKEVLLFKSVKRENLSLSPSKKLKTNRIGRVSIVKRKMILVALCCAT